MKIRKQEMFQYSLSADNDFWFSKEAFLRANLLDEEEKKTVIFYIQNRHNKDLYFGVRFSSSLDYDTSDAVILELFKQVLVKKTSKV